MSIAIPFNTPEAALEIKKPSRIYFLFIIKDMFSKTVSDDYPFPSIVDARVTTNLQPTHE